MAQFFAEYGDLLWEGTLETLYMTFVPTLAAYLIGLPMGAQELEFPEIAEPVTLKVGASPSPHAEILEHVAPILAEHNVTLDIVEFDDYVMPNTGVEDGSLDANYFQHQPYLDDFNAENGTHIVSVGVVHYEPMGLYPGKTSSLDVFNK